MNNDVNNILVMITQSMNTRIIRINLINYWVYTLCYSQWEKFLKWRRKFPILGNLRKS